MYRQAVSNTFLFFCQCREYRIVNDQKPVGDAILRTLAYADVFDYPMTAGEVYRYLIGLRAEASEIQTVLNDCLEPAGAVQAVRQYYTLPGRAALAARRMKREQIAARLWPQAVRFGSLIARLPFVRMVAVTGALAVNNVDTSADIDYLIVTKPGRLWLCRALIIAVVRFAAMIRVRLCPNYILSENAFVFPNPSLYAAHELVQMVPISGMNTYHLIRSMNEWTQQYLPNAEGVPALHKSSAYEPDQTAWRSISERILQNPFLEKVEMWEMRRKIMKFEKLDLTHIEATFARDWCKGHFDAHGIQTVFSYHERLNSLNLSTES
jgi:hypothetical protein